ncbi:restriction endonuclease subunit S [Microvirga sp. BT688]|uniref:restriction endonuclease subunit S n=1 Tax=Microvirga sp. TaxID=1873136 RepID=UPI001683D0AA|nr:restriction endonuclease subunit S [Microvirga sp.]MBD2747766.1 restriction endonuclease subunit S [Microvirga sp.]
MIFPPEKQAQRLKWAFESCKNGAWGTEPDGDHDVVCIRAADFDGQLGRLNNGDRTLRAIDRDTFKKIELRPGDLVLEKSGGGEKQLVGRTILFDGTTPSVCSNFLARCRPSRGVEPAFLNYLMLAIYYARGTFPHIKQSTGIQNLDLPSLLNTRVSIPSLEAQRTIAQFLNEKTTTINRLIEKKRALLERLAERRQTIITCAVTKGLNVATPLKASGVTWLGDIPAHWVVSALGYRYEVQLGRMLNAERAYGDHLKPYLRVYDVQWGRINVDDLPLMDYPPSAQERYRLRPGDLLVNEGGSYVGRSAIWRGELEECYYQKALHRLRPLNPQLDTAEFLYFVMEMATKNDVFIAGGNQTTIDHLTAEQLRHYRFAFPPLEEQNQIVAALSTSLRQNEELREKISLSIERLEEYRAALITSAVTGDIAGLQ